MAENGQRSARMAAVADDRRVAAPLKRAPLSGWGRYPRCLTDIYRPEKFAELAELITADPHQLVARGAGRAYGDAALNAPGRVIDVTRFNRMLAFDDATGLLRCEAGVTLGDIIDTFRPRGFFPVVTPGTRFITVGGAIAADVHGKNHHRDSSIAAHLASVDVMLASGEIRRCSSGENAGLFHATAGGMGLTGVIVEAELKLRRIATAWIESETVRAANIDHAIEIFDRSDRLYDYSVGWIDCASAASALGRSVINFGNFATLDQLDGKRRAAPLSLKPRRSLSVPIDFPGFALGPFTVTAFNELYFRTHRDTPRALIDCERFFYPLDSIRDWNRVYGASGFVQYQCAWPMAESRAGLVETLEAIARSRRASFLAVVKKFGAQDGLLSFPMPGYTLSLDFPMRPGLRPFLDQLDAMVLQRGGRLYLAKDARMSPAMFHAGYPRLAEWRAVKAAVDPNNHFSSSLSRRLEMVPV
ncbi:MAG TPA: FAD-binding oxidoreductase [Candidatus Binataceae bacterium]|nr:FAD-binding oxidoreductase [Candidatus Binataceae bacterium]